MSLCSVLAATVAPAWAADAGTTLVPEVARFVEQYQPIWLPAARELAGVVVLIDPAGGGATTAEARRQDDLCLWTGAHLYHLVRTAGGTHLLNRPDDRPVIATVTSRRPPDVVVRIVPDAERADVDMALQESNPPTLAVRVPTSHAEAVGGVPAHRLWAEQIYKYLAKNAKDLRHGRSESDADSPPAPVPYYPLQTPDAAFASGGSAIWPDGPLPASKAAWFCNMFMKQFFSDRTNVYFEPVVTVSGESVTIGGALTHPTLTGVLERALKRAGIKDVQTKMTLLPEEGRISREEWFGACVAPMALTYSKPFEGAPVQTQFLYGEPVYVLDRQDGFILAHGGDGYWGWVRENCIRTMSRAEFTKYLSPRLAVLLKDIEHDGRRIVRESRLPLQGNAGMTAMLPDGGTLALERDQARIVDEGAVGPMRVQAALAMLETPYVFAGKSCIGLDCSGLVGTVCDQFGTVLPRDAAQQFVTGRLVGTRWFLDAMRPGDRIYFLNDVGKISHTGMWIGDRHFVHSSPPAVQINSLREGDRLYRDKWDSHFLGARRP